MKRFVEGVDRSQGTLFPDRLEDWIGDDNPVRAIDVFVDELDLGVSLLKTSYRTESLVFPLNAGYFLRHANDRLSPPRHSP